MTKRACSGRRRDGAWTPWRGRSRASRLRPVPGLPLAQVAHDAPHSPAVAAFIQGLETRKDREHLTEIVESGLRLVHGQPASSKREPHELALALLAHFPTDDLALELADALAKQANLASGTGSLLDVVARAIADRLPRIPKLREAKLARHLAQLLDRLIARRIAVAGAAGAVTAMVVLLPLPLLPPWFSRVPLTPSGFVLPPSAQVIVLANAEQGGAPVVFDLRALLGAVTGEMGKKEPQENWMPTAPLPGQKLAACDARLGERPINGGCWFASLDVKPPCGLLFRHGDICYRPVAADPNVPIGGQGAH